MTHFIPGQLTDTLRILVQQQVQAALKEDLGSGDLSISNLAQQDARAKVITYDAGILAGTFWFDEVFSQLNPATQVHWNVNDGDPIHPDQELCTVTGKASDLLTGERCALNFLQTLAATATQTAAFVHRAKGKITIKDTRKTLPGLRVAQKYAVVCGGGINHRENLATGVLLKENHIRAYGSIAQAIHAIRTAQADVSIEIETENLSEVRAAIAANADIIMLDNFTPDDIDAAVALIADRAKIEVSGNINLDNLQQMIRAGVDYISIGAITKHIHALDMSMRLE